jgi:hypothetical protein
VCSSIECVVILSLARRCALRIRLTGTEEWFEVTEIDCKYLTREVSASDRSNSY